MLLPRRAAFKPYTRRLMSKVEASRLALSLEHFTPVPLSAPGEGEPRLIS